MNEQLFTADNKGAQVSFEEEKKMWIAAIKLAIFDIKEGAKKTKKEKSDAVLMNYNTAKNWLLRKKDNGVGSFVWVCNFLGMDPSLTRTQILRIEQ